MYRTARGTSLHGYRLCYFVGFQAAISSEPAVFVCRREALEGERFIGEKDAHAKLLR